MKAIIVQAVEGLMSAVPFLLHTDGSGKDYKMSTARILELLIMALAVGVINYYSIQSLKTEVFLMLSGQATTIREVKEKQDKFEKDFYSPNFQRKQ